MQAPCPPCSAGGGGGIGIHICRTEDEVASNIASAARQGAAAFGNAGVFVEKYVQVRVAVGRAEESGRPVLAGREHAFATCAPLLP